MALENAPLVEPRNHHVQFCVDATLLARKVAAFLAEGLREGEAVAIVARPERRAPFRDALAEVGYPIEELVAEGRLAWLDARETLARLMTPDGPEWTRFNEVVGWLVRGLKARWGGLRAYGEMVDLLRVYGDIRAAVRLEELWNVLLQREGFSLFCNYSVDLLDSDVRGEDLESILSRHSHAHSPRSSRELGEAVGRALNDVLGAEAMEALGPLIRGTRYPGASVSGPEAALLWVRRHLPGQARDVLSRARAYAEAAGVVGG